MTEPTSTKPPAKSQWFHGIAVVCGAIAVGFQVHAHHYAVAAFLAVLCIFVIAEMVRS